MNYITYSEAYDEAKRLSRDLNRAVEVATKDCPCDYNVKCGTCYGQGYTYQLRYGFCNHLVHDDNDNECDVNFCAEQERVKAEQLEPLRIEHAPLKSCTQVESEREQEREVNAA